MTIGKLKQILEENNIPDDVQLYSDSGWECDATDMNGIWYNEKLNELVFTQGNKYEYDLFFDVSYDGYTKAKGWQMLHCPKE